MNSDTTATACPGVLLLYRGCPDWWLPQSSTYTWPLRFPALVRLGPAVVTCTHCAQGHTYSQTWSTDQCYAWNVQSNKEGIGGMLLSELCLYCCSLAAGSTAC